MSRIWLISCLRTPHCWRTAWRDREGNFVTAVDSDSRRGADPQRWQHTWAFLRLPEFVLVSSSHSCQPTTKRAIVFRDGLPIGATDSAPRGWGLANEDSFGTAVPFPSLPFPPLPFPHTTTTTPPHHHITPRTHVIVCMYLHSEVASTLLHLMAWPRTRHLSDAEQAAF